MGNKGARQTTTLRNASHLSKKQKRKRHLEAIFSEEEISQLSQQINDFETSSTACLCSSKNHNKHYKHHHNMDEQQQQKLESFWFHVPIDYHFPPTTPHKQRNCNNNYNLNDDLEIRYGRKQRALSNSSSFSSSSCGSGTTTSINSSGRNSSTSISNNNFNINFNNNSCNSCNMIEEDETYLLSRELKLSPRVASIEKLPPIEYDRFDNLNDFNIWYLKNSFVLNLDEINKKYIL
ncbi:hypothetical protein ABK040_010767 [Willaertia magna]